MAYSVIRTDTFETSYDQCIGYLAINLASPQAATRFMSEIDHVASILESTPFVRGISEKRYLAERRLREYFVMNYVVVYRIDEDVVTFVNLFHQTQEYDSERYWED